MTTENRDPHPGAADPHGPGLDRGSIEVGVPKRYDGALPGKRAYPWTCVKCGTAQVGFVENGCTVCGVGRDAIQGVPDPPRDVTCRACRGDKTISRRCKPCAGSGEVDDAACANCGGAGTEAVECGRCKGLGIDPEPRIVNVVNEDAMSRHDEMTRPDPDEPSVGMARIMREAAPTTGLNQKVFPTIEDDSPAPSMVPARVQRYLLIEYDGPPEVLQQLIRWQQSTNGSDGTINVTVVEITRSPKVDAIIRAEKEKR